MLTFSVPGRARRKLTRRDLPYLFLRYAIVLGLVAFGVVLIGKLDMAKKSNLKSVAGIVLQKPRWQRTKGGPIIVIRVEMGDGPHDLVEEDLSHYQAIMSLKPGDHITALVMSFVGYHIWELKRDGVMLESYKDMYLYQTAMNERGATAAYCSGLLSLICMMVALVLRMYFGTWRDPTRLVPADAGGSV